MGWVQNLLIDRGYTGHEHLTSIGLIHMNGRIYDPQLRRFLSPDNYVQDTENTQNYNRFGYVYNNPLLYTDPSGELAFLAVLAIAVIMHAINNIANGVPFWHGMGKTMAISAITCGITAGIGAAANAAFSTATTVGKALFQAGLHGIVGGVMSSIEGGSFESGFAAGAISSLVSSGISALGETGGIGTNADGSKFAIQNNFGKSSWFKATMITSAGLSGGLSSSIAGGSFWAGARQGVIVAAMNHLAHMEFDKSGENEVDEEQEQQEDPPTKKKPTLDEIARSEGYTNHQFKLLYEFNKLALDVRTFFVGDGAGASNLAIAPVKLVRLVKLTVKAETFHRIIKPQILKNAGNTFQKFVGNNPDILIKGEKIFLQGVGPYKGKIHETVLKASDYF
jgi:RHS repeat-associated protein